MASALAAFKTGGPRSAGSELSDLRRPSCDERLRAIASTFQKRKIRSRHSRLANLASDGGSSSTRFAPVSAPERVRYHV